MADDNLTTQLESLRTRRGYLLPHHGLMAAFMPGLLEAYDRLYSLLTSAQGHLNQHDHESVWLGILSARDEEYGSHHVSQFLEAGGGESELRAILAITAMARGSMTYSFVEQHWRQYLPGFDAASAYLSAFSKMADPLPAALAHLVGVAAHTCLRNRRALAWQIRAAYADDVEETSLAEALSMTMFPGSVPNFVAACAVWQQLIVNGEVDASPPFVSWAQFAGQGGWNEAFEQR